MSPAEKKRLAAYKTACAINAVEGVPVSRYAKALSHSWVRGELTGEQMKKRFWIITAALRSRRAEAVRDLHD